MYLWYFVTRTQSCVILNLSKLYFLFNQWEWNNSVMYFVFSNFFLNFYFCKKISDDSITLAQKEKFPKKYPNLFFESTLNFGGLSYCGSLLSHLRVYMPLFLWIRGYCFPLISWWHMLGSRVGQPYLSGRRKREGGICMLVSSPLTGKRRWKWWTFLRRQRNAWRLGSPSLSLPRGVMIHLRLVLISSPTRTVFPPLTT